MPDDTPTPCPPFGAYPPSSLQAWMMRTGRAMPPTRLGRRVCSTLRSLLRRASSAPVDAEVLGQRMRLHPAGNAGEKRLLISPQYFDPEELATLARIAGPDFAFVDIGANVGTYSLFVARHAGPGARLLAVEPHPVARERLRCNLALNGIGQVVVAPVAVSDTDGELELHIDARNIGSTSARSDHVGTPSGTSFKVPARTLLSLLAEHGFDRIDALKIDIEGAEDMALAPFFATAPAALLPCLVIIEDNRASWRTDLFAVMQDKGYARTPLDNGNVILERR